LPAQISNQYVPMDEHPHIYRSFLRIAFQSINRFALLFLSWLHFQSIWYFVYNIPDLNCSRRHPHLLVSTKRLKAPRVGRVIVHIGDLALLFFLRSSLLFLTLLNMIMSIYISPLLIKSFGL